MIAMFFGIFRKTVFSLPLLRYALLLPTSITLETAVNISNKKRYQFRNQ